MVPLSLGIVAHWKKIACCHCLALQRIDQSQAKGYPVELVRRILSYEFAQQFADYTIDSNIHSYGQPSTSHPSPQASIFLLKYLSAHGSPSMQARKNIKKHKNSRWQKNNFYETSGYIQSKRMSPRKKMGPALQPLQATKVRPVVKKISPRGIENLEGATKTTGDLRFPVRAGKYAFASSSSPTPHNNNKQQHTTTK